MIVTNKDKPMTEETICPAECQVQISKRVTWRGLGGALIGIISILVVIVLWGMDSAKGHRGILHGRISEISEMAIKNKESIAVLIEKVTHFISEQEKRAERQNRQYDRIMKKLDEMSE
jgi:hypothetical protein